MRCRPPSTVRSDKTQDARCESRDNGHEKKKNKRKSGRQRREGTGEIRLQLQTGALKANKVHREEEVRSVREHEEEGERKRQRHNSEAQRRCAVRKCTSAGQKRGGSPRQTSLVRTKKKRWRSAQVPAPLRLVELLPSVCLSLGCAEKQQWSTRPATCDSSSCDRPAIGAVVQQPLSTRLCAKGRAACAQREDLPRRPRTKRRRGKGVVRS